MSTVIRTTDGIVEVFRNDGLGPDAACFSEKIHMRLPGGTTLVFLDDKEAYDVARALMREVGCEVPK
jgi:hypothetical protein